MTDNDIKAELSYAYLHAVASRLGLSCQLTSRTIDNLGIDAVLRAKKRFSADSIYTEFSLDVQLKATSTSLTLHNDQFSFPLEIDSYDKLRHTERASPIILVVLRLSDGNEDWLKQTEDELIIKHCAYWVSLRNAPFSSNTSNQTVYLPKCNLFDVSGLESLMTRISRQEEINYGQ